VRPAAKILAAAALLAVFASASGKLAAGGTGPAIPPMGWHHADRLVDDGGRLKRARAYPAASRQARPLLRWRAPLHVDLTEDRSNEWRLVAPRSAEPAMARAPAQTGLAASEPAGYETVLLREINEVRAHHGLPELRSSSALTAAAEHHSRQMAARGFFEHDSPDGSAFWKRVERYYPSRGSSYWSVGENLAYGSPSLSAGGAVRAWMDSPGHRANLLSSTWREVGLAAVHAESAPGVYGGRKTTVVTADFGVRR
jgi:uncharacterized protein YkwD